MAINNGSACISWPIVKNCEDFVGAKFYCLSAVADSNWSI